MCLELFKVLQSKHIEDYRNTFVNLAIPFFAMAEPLAPKLIKYKDMTWSLWDRWIFNGNIIIYK